MKFVKVESRSIVSVDVPVVICSCMLVDRVSPVQVEFFDVVRLVKTVVPVDVVDVVADTADVVEMVV